MEPSRFGELEERYRALIQHLSGTVVSVLDTDLRFSYVGGSIEELGWSQDELIGRRVEEFVDPDSPIVAAYRAALAGTPQLFDATTTRGDRQMRVQVVPLRAADGAVTGVMAIGQDVTARASIERELRDARDELESAFHFAAIGKAIVGLDGSWLNVNRALCELVGYSEEELLGLSFQDITHPGDLDADLEYVRQLVAGEIASYQMEKRYIAKDGAVIPVLLSVSLVRSPEGEPLRFLSEIQDWRNEVQRRELAREVGEHRRADALNVLAGGLAHDFNNLLVGILGHTSLALSDIDPSSRAGIHLVEVERAARSIAHLTDQMLAFSGKTWLELEPLDPAAHVRGVVEGLRPSLPEGVRIQWSLAPDTPSVSADATHLARVTESLLANAAEAIEGDGTVSVGTGTLYLTRPALDSYSVGREAQPGLFAYIEVSDDGIGMDAETQARMFEPFFTTKFQGRGLGLASVQGLVRSHGGALAVHSAPGEGTRVRLLLPAA